MISNIDCKILITSEPIVFLNREAMASHAPEHTEISSSSCRSTGREKDQWVIVYDPHEHDLFTERVENLSA